jgi:hypothetical protein
MFTRKMVNAATLSLFSQSCKLWCIHRSSSMATLDAAFLARVLGSSNWQAIELESLALQREGIAHLGHALRGFTALLQLNLARNCLESLQGIEHCTALVRLSLFHNCIAAHSEVQRLTALPHLAVLDIRLNPISRHKGTYAACIDVSNLDWLAIMPFSVCVSACRVKILAVLPKLQQLDEQKVTQPEIALAAQQAVTIVDASGESASSESSLCSDDQPVAALRQVASNTRDVVTAVADTHDAEDR